ncbi:MAG: hypothetical protein U0V56_12145 [Actinomycetota bacterium]
MDDRPVRQVGVVADRFAMSETTVESTEVRGHAVPRPGKFTAELQEIARAKAPDHVASSRGFWNKLRGKS